MRAKFIFEKFTENDSDPIADMHIGYPAKQLNTKAWKILDFIRSKGEEGASFTEIQHFIWVELQGGKEKDFWKKEEVRTGWWRSGGESVTKQRASRGNYCTNLYGCGSYYTGHRGLLHKYCKKNDKGKWVLVRMPKPYEAIYK
jgi:hypothetical protein